MKLSKKKIIFMVFALIVLAGYVLPENLIIPVKGASTADWNQQSFWYEPWGVSGVHKGIDIFGQKGTPLLSSSKGIVIYTGNIAIGGNVVLILGPKWRLHYYAHLNNISINTFYFTRAGDEIGTVGDSGNAKGKAPHLHYSIITMVPYTWRIDDSNQGWKKMFFLDPNRRLSG